ncbi:hypothetical protein DUNSADRAFT_18334 [Dunaliella salina]|uniref:Encoded protein n=1 Tax=Dunaliella salina TaxID=3046 RepID=A0ABQ7GZ79_DUNSA|nr:hypothetical protein DUNSADRAFT_18334 [Dunaliella salina]|eukprot:KAF5839920.1 hypothetical protein DUNSADRAFT_18334 [Dunaliella salina]
MQKRATADARKQAAQQQGARSLEREGKLCCWILFVCMVADADVQMYNVVDLASQCHMHGCVQERAARPAMNCTTHVRWLASGCVSGGQMACHSAHSRLLVVVGQIKFDDSATGLFSQPWANRVCFVCLKSPTYCCVLKIVTKVL